MVALWNRADDYIFILSFVLLLVVSSFFPRLISAVAEWMSAIRVLYCLSVNWRSRSETCCMRLAEITGCKKVAKNHQTILSGYIFTTEACINNRKKNLLSSNMSSTCPHNMPSFGPLAAEIGLVVWGTPANLNGFRILAALLHGI